MDGTFCGTARLSRKKRLRPRTGFGYNARALAESTEADYRSEIRKTGWQALLLCARVGALVVAILAHLALNWAVHFVVPEGYGWAEKVLKVVFFGCFSLVYVHQAFDMVVVFVPWIRSKP